MRGQRGLTLAELLVTLAVATLLAAIGIPAFSELQERTRILGAFHLLSSSLSLARMASISHNVPVAVCPSQDGRRCRGDGVWDAGWIVYLDPPNAAAAIAPGAILRHEDGIRGVEVRSSLGRPRLRYRPDGFSAGSNLSLWLCLARGRREIGRVVVNNGGRVRTERHASPVACRFAANSSPDA